MAKLKTGGRPGKHDKMGRTTVGIHQWMKVMGGLGPKVPTKSGVGERLGACVGGLGSFPLQCSMYFPGSLPEVE